MSDTLKESAVDIIVTLATENAALKHDLDAIYSADCEHLAEIAELRGRLEVAEKERDAIAELNHGQFLQLEYLRPVDHAAHVLYTESEEFEFDDGMGRGAQQTYWDDLAKALEPATEAIRAEVALASEPERSPNTCPGRDKCGPTDCKYPQCWAGMIDERSGVERRTSTYIGNSERWLCPDLWSRENKDRRQTKGVIADRRVK